MNFMVWGAADDTLPLVHKHRDGHKKHASAIINKQGNREGEEVLGVTSWTDIQVGRHKQTNRHTCSKQNVNTSKQQGGTKTGLVWPTTAKKIIS